PKNHFKRSLRDTNGEIIWPAPKNKIKAARKFIQECVSAKQRTLIVPDRDVDGLTSGAILERTLVLLGLDKDLISVHTIRKGGRLDDDVSRKAMADYKPAFIFVLDHGSQQSPPLIDAPHRAIVIDHHYAEENEHPQDALLVTADNSPPVATSSLLTYLICLDLHEEVKEICDWLCVLGTLGELGNMVKWEPPFPNMKPTIEMHKTGIIYQAISLIHAPRRTAACDVTIAWKALRAASSPKELTKDKNLVAARREIHEEFMRCNKSAAPRFSADGRVVVIYLSSEAQVHPLIASRWASYLYTDLVEVVLVANEGYSPGMVSFSCRVAKCAKGMFPPVDTIKFLRETADRAADPTLRDRLGESFARGHKVASGGKVPKAEFEELMEVL
ncbi:uncharacterized protein NECHADRAFT_24662, partial [Fusarium vanettenii 77-13-4]